MTNDRPVVKKPSMLRTAQILQADEILSDRKRKSRRETGWTWGMCKGLEDNLFVGPAQMMVDDGITDRYTSLQLASLMIRAATRARPKLRMISRGEDRTEERGQRELFETLARLRNGGAAFSLTRSCKYANMPMNAALNVIR